MMNKFTIEPAYCLLHQKLRVYEFSTDAKQRDAIEQAVGSYSEAMSPELYNQLSGGHADYLRCHDGFEADLRHAVKHLETMLAANN